VQTNFLVHDNTTGVITEEEGTPFVTGVGASWQFTDLSPDNLDIASVTPKTFIHSGSGNDAINVSGGGGNNTLDAEGGSNFLVGGSGNDTFFLNDLNPAGPIWSTLVNFHAGDAVTVWGVTKADFSLSWMDGQGAAGYTGLTAHITAPGKPNELLTFAGSEGPLAIQYGSTYTGPTLGNVPYMEISR
jgi:Ca2+-binding RTX toxin-like protein